MVRYSTIGIFSISSAISGGSFLPLYWQQQQLWLTDIVEMRAAAIELYRQNTQAIAEQITSRTQVRQVLEDYNLGRITLEELPAFSTDKRQEALHCSQEIMAISRYDAEQQLVIEVGCLFTKRARV